MSNHLPSTIDKNYSGVQAMGLFSWLVNPFQATTNMVVENAVTQYGKIKKADTSVEEGDIASVLWTHRYMNAKLSDEAERRLARYMLSGFVVRNMVDFCLGTMDIELQVDPNNGNYRNA